MKICTLTTGFPRFEGDFFGSFVGELAFELARQGEQVEVVAPHQSGVARQGVERGVGLRRFAYWWPLSRQCVAYGGGIPTNLKESMSARLQVPVFLLAFWYMARRVSRDCDLVHSHWTISGLIAYWATRLRPKPLVLSVRGSDMHLMDHGLGAKINSWVYGRMDRILAVSEDIAARLEAKGVDPDKIRVVPNGVDPCFAPGDQVNARHQLGLPKRKVVILFVGLLVPVKGLDVLLQALDQLVGTDWCCALVGDGPQKKALQQQAAKASWGKQLVWAGRRDRREIPVWMQAADMLVLPSRAEGRPNVVLEAMASGLPVVATRVGGTPELVESEVTGLLVDSGQPQALARALKVLVGDARRRQHLGAAARQTILNRGLSWQNSAAQVRQIYAELLAGGKYVRHCR